MNYVAVCFPNSPREYIYKTELNLITGAIYDIVADNKTVYESPVRVKCQIGDYKNYTFLKGIREITKATCRTAPPINQDNIEKVFFNDKKRTTVVLWKDGVRTKVKCSPEDHYSREAGLALCYMKRFFGNRGAYNNTLRKWCEESDINEE